MHIIVIANFDNNNINKSKIFDSLVISNFLFSVELVKKRILFLSHFSLIKHDSIGLFDINPPSIKHLLSNKNGLKIKGILQDAQTASYSFILG